MNIFNGFTQYFLDIISGVEEYEMEFVSGVNFEWNLLLMAFHRNLDAIGIASFIIITVLWYNQDTLINFIEYDMRNYTG